MGNIAASTSESCPTFNGMVAIVYVGLGSTALQELALLTVLTGLVLDFDTGEAVNRYDVYLVKDRSRTRHLVNKERVLRRAAFNDWHESTIKYLYLLSDISDKYCQKGRLVFRNLREGTVRQFLNLQTALILYRCRTSRWQKDCSAKPERPGPHPYRGDASAYQRIICGRGDRSSEAAKAWTSPQRCAGEEGNSHRDQV
jgi:hypothetical protein